jgi:hypothetical protein
MIDSIEITRIERKKELIHAEKEKLEIEKEKLKIETIMIKELKEK